MPRELEVCGAGGGHGGQKPQLCVGTCAAFREISFRADVEFPSDYPSGCLLGCVDVTDCLSQEQFNEQVSTANKPAGALR